MQLVTIILLNENIPNAQFVVGDFQYLVYLFLSHQNKLKSGESSRKRKVKQKRRRNVILNHKQWKQNGNTYR